MPKRNRVLMTGSSGMLGIDLSSELRPSYDIYGMDLAANPKSGPITFRECNIQDTGKVASVVSDISPDAVIHMAAWTDVDGCERDLSKAYAINSKGTEAVALACKEKRIPLIYISTDFVFDGKKSGYYTEDEVTGPLSVYGDSKLKGEEAVSRILDKYFILRTSWLYGRYGKNFVDTIAAKSITEKSLRVVDDQVGSPTYTKDLARAIHILLDKIFSANSVSAGDYGIYHLSNSGRVSWYEYAKEIIRLSGSSAKVEAISSQALARPAKRPAVSSLDNSKFLRFTGYKMREWKEALSEYLSNNNDR